MVSSSPAIAVWYDTSKSGRTAVTDCRCVSEGRISAAWQLLVMRDGTEKEILDENLIAVIPLSSIDTQENVFSQAHVDGLRNRINTITQTMQDVPLAFKQLQDYRGLLQADLERYDRGDRKVDGVWLSAQAFEASQRSQTKPKILSPGPIIADATTPKPPPMIDSIPTASDESSGQPYSTDPPTEPIRQPPNPNPPAVQNEMIAVTTSTDAIAIQTETRPESELTKEPRDPLGSSLARASAPQPPPMLKGQDTASESDSPEMSKTPDPAQQPESKREPSERSTVPEPPLEPVSPTPILRGPIWFRPEIWIATAVALSMIGLGFLTRRRRTATERYFVLTGTGVIGPLTIKALRNQLRRGAIQPSSRCYRLGSKEIQTIGDLIDMPLK